MNEKGCESDIHLIIFTCCHYIFKFFISFVLCFKWQMDYRIKEILTKIETDISRPLTIHELAASINISVPHFQHLFKKEVQICTIKYINNLRLEKARRMLETTHLCVKEIRLAVGAPNEAHFLHNFKRRFGATPKNYRKNFHGVSRDLPK